MAPVSLTLKRKKVRTLGSTSVLHDDVTLGKGGGKRKKEESIECHGGAGPSTKHDIGGGTTPTNGNGSGGDCEPPSQVVPSDSDPVKADAPKARAPLLLSTVVPSMDELPDAPDVEDDSYSTVKVDDFGMNMLKMMGYKGDADGESTADSEKAAVVVKRRPQRLGLGAKPKKEEKGEHRKKMEGQRDIMKKDKAATTTAPAATPHTAPTYSARPHPDSKVSISNICLLRCVVCFVCSKKKSILTPPPPPAHHIAISPTASPTSPSPRNTEKRVPALSRSKRATSLRCWTRQEFGWLIQLTTGKVTWRSRSRKRNLLLRCLP